MRRISFSFQSTRPLRDGTKMSNEVYDILKISIHPPLAGRDVIMLPLCFTVLISIHPPLAGRDGSGALIIQKWTQFQSTRPLRDGTCRVIQGDALAGISIHPPLAGRDAVTNRV